MSEDATQAVENGPEENGPEENGPGDLLTVPEAAALLGITERALRRRLARPEYAAGTRQVTRRTRTGTRTSAGLPPRLVQALKASFESETDAAEHGGNAAERGERQQAEQREEGQLSPLVAALLTEREARLADKDAEIARLSETLSQTQAALQKALDTIGREQALRALLPHAEAGQVSAWKRFKGWFGGNE
jgi:hypothetical protein